MRRIKLGRRKIVPCPRSLDCRSGAAWLPGVYYIADVVERFHGQPGAIWFRPGKMRCRRRVVVDQMAT
jgi:hypothetical protein